MAASHNKWNVRKGYLKIHVAVDIKKKRIISFDVTNEEVYDGSRLKKLITNALKNNTLKGVIADVAHDNKEDFRYLYDNNIEAAIKVRKSSNSAKSSNSLGCYSPRKIAVLKHRKNFEKRKHSISYGHRWIAESVFSNKKKDVGRICIFKGVSKHGKGDDVESIIIQCVCNRVKIYYYVL